MQRCLLILFLFLSWGVSQAEYEFCNVEVAEMCVEGAETRTIDGMPIYRDCWAYQTTYHCYTPAEPLDCTAQESALPRHELASVLEMTEQNQLVEWVEWKDTSTDCVIDDTFGCSDWYVTEDGFDARTCYVGEKNLCSPEDCSVFTQTCTQFTNGICTEELIRYSCSGDSVCTGNVGLVTTDDESIGFAEALATNSLADLVASEGFSDPVTGQIRLFEGKQQGCHYVSEEWKVAAVGTSAAVVVAAIISGSPMAAAPFATYASALSSGKMNCCRNDPDDVDVGGSLGYCSEDHIELAVAKKAKRAVELGSKFQTGCFCSDLTGLIVRFPLDDGNGSISDCDELCGNPYLGPVAWGKKETMDWQREYCVFDSQLARIIQEEGRLQIEEILNSPASTDRESSGFDYNYNSGGVGRWSPSLTLRDNSIQMWQWTDECFLPGGQAKSLTGEIICPVYPEVYFLVCSNPYGCGDEPLTPLVDSGLWDIMRAPANRPKERFSANNYVQMMGECFSDEGDGTTISMPCDWNVVAWPAGVGSSLVQKTDLTWEPKFPMPDSEDYTWLYSTGTSTLMIEMLTTTNQELDPVEPTIRLADVGSDQWEEFVLPVTIDDPDFTITRASGDVLYVSGSCGKYVCNYQLSRSITLTLRPWYEDIDGGHYDHCLLPDPIFGGCADEKRANRKDDRHGFCEGFTLDEFTALDLNSMDLSEYIDTLSDRAKEAMLDMLDTSGD